MAMTPHTLNATNSAAGTSTVPTFDLLPPAAYQWHVRPKGLNGECSLCGYVAESHSRREHRAVCGNEGIPGWIARRWRKWSDRKKCGWEYVRFDLRGRPVKNAVGRVGPQQRTVDRLIRAAILSAQGMTPAEVAKAIGATVKRLWDWKSRHAAIWKKAFDDEASRLRPVIVGQAGTDVIVKDPESYLRKATAVER